MLTRREFVAIAGGAALAPASAPAEPIPSASPLVQSEDARQEVAQIKAFMETTHPRGLEALHNAVWNGRAAALAKRANALSFSHYVVELSSLIAWFEDGHSQVLPYRNPLQDFALQLPLVTGAFTDGLFVTGAEGQALPLLHGRVTRVCGVPINEALTAFSNAFAKDNLAWARRWSPNLLRTAGLLRGLDILGSGEGTVRVEVTRSSGETTAADLSLIPLREGHNGQLPDPKINTLQPLADGKVLYLRLDEMRDQEGYSIGDITNRLYPLMRNPAVERIIIDLRRNGGGNNQLTEELRHRLGRSRFNEPGRLYVLIGPGTFSAAQCLTSRLERETYAILVGEPTGCRPNHFGDPETLQARAGAILVFCSTLRWQDMPPSDHRTSTMPNILVPTYHDDFPAGRDRPLQAALRHRPGMQDPLRIEAPWARSSQGATWLPFWCS